MIIRGDEIYIEYDRWPIQVNGFVHFYSPDPKYLGEVRHFSIRGYGLVRIPRAYIYIVMGDRVFVAEDPYLLDEKMVLQEIPEEKVNLDGAREVYSSKFIKVYIRGGDNIEKIVYVAPLDKYYSTVVEPYEYNILLFFLGDHVYIENKDGIIEIFGDAVVGRKDSEKNIISYIRYTDFKIMEVVEQHIPKYVWPIMSGKVRMYLPIFELVKTQYTGIPERENENIETVIIDVTKLKMGTNFKIINGYLVMF